MAAPSASHRDKFEITGNRWRGMRLACLYSGGKDSTYSAYLMEQQGHRVCTLVNIVPSDPYSWVFHTLNLEAVPLMAQAMGKRLVSVPSDGTEIGDLAALRQGLEGLNVDGVVVGAIASDYQWDRINGVCESLGLRLFAPMWRKDQLTLLNDMVEAGVKAIIVGVFAEGLDQKWLGRTIDHDCIDDLVKVAEKHGINVSGEGGEYETMALDSPMHGQPIKIESTETVVERDTARLLVKKCSLDYV
jgi:ABC transporter with metal-binding/Fe-S-binding domain ATP-binding protein